jgi:aryl-alcohol dehydrogenase-like predicted oxidoreductase
MKDIQPTIDCLTAIGQAHGVNPTTVALNYNMSKGVVPTIGIRKPQHAKDAVAALGWRLSTDEISRLEKVSMEGSSTILWQQG